ncbi:MAG: hypothetical protein J3Q66DRAFT_396066 [Benniella sp.]|nr:MAG: hypothetical protein J3Q66DRAFT_396066 [Benniella sp.]
MDDFYQFMSPLEGATNNANDRPSTRADPKPTDHESAPSESSSAQATPSRSSWSTWGTSFNKLIERGKKDMNEFVDVTRKDFTELVHTVQQEHSTTIESISKKVGDLNSTSADIFGRIKQEITEAATGKPSTSTEGSDGVGASTAETENSSIETESKAGDESITDSGNKTPSVESRDDEKATESATTSTTTTTATRGERSASLSFANTASLLSAGASTLTQTLSSSTRDISSTANELFKKKLPAVAEKRLGDADLFLKNTTETLKTNGLLAEQYVNKLGAGMANFLNNAVVVSAPEEKENASRSKKMIFDRKAATLEKLRTDPDTYTVDPMTTIADNDIVRLERYKYFLQTFNVAEYQQRISRMLNEYPEVKTLMRKLVPAEVADEELFWLRYYYRLFEIEEEEKRRKKLVQEAGVDLAEEDFTWDDNDDDDQEGEASEGQGSVTPRASQSLAGSQAGLPLTAEALASSLAALPVLDDQAASSGNGAKARQGSDDEWGTEESPKSPSAKSFSIKSSSGMQSKSSTTNASSTRTSEDTYEVVDGVGTPVRAPVASTTSVLSATSSPAPGQPAQHPGSSKSKSAESKDPEDDWSDWE